MNRVDTNMQLIWLRSDLRLHDNTAPSAAAAHGPCVAVYRLSPEQWLDHDDAPCKVDFWPLCFMNIYPYWAGQLPG
jgi:deoxyribodipyrimidine photo-lyase